MTEKKEIKQENMEEYIDAIEKQLDSGFIGLITEINNITNTAFFGETTYEERNGFVITVKVRGDDSEFSQWFSKPSLRGYEQSNLFAFKQKYKSIPIKGLEILCHIDENGFYKITL